MVVGEDKDCLADVPCRSLLRFMNINGRDNKKSRRRGRERARRSKIAAAWPARRADSPPHLPHLEVNE